MKIRKADFVKSAVYEKDYPIFWQYRWNGFCRVQSSV